VLRRAAQAAQAAKTEGAVIAGEPVAKGFTLYMVKAVMNGRTDEVIGLARTNLWR
jgi:hypothetical protein